MSEIRNILERTNRVTETEGQIKELEDKMVEITEAENNKESQRPWDNIKCNHIGLIEVLEEDKRKGHEKNI